MNTGLVLNLALLGGAILGGALLAWLFCRSLWWTTGKGLVAKRPELWFFGSMIARTGVMLFGFYGLSQGQWWRLLVSIASFTVARAALIRRFKQRVGNGSATCGGVACASAPTN